MYHNKQTITIRRQKVRKSFQNVIRNGRGFMLFSQGGKETSSLLLFFVTHLFIHVYKIYVIFAPFLRNS